RRAVVVAVSVAAAAAVLHCRVVEEESLRVLPVDERRARAGALAGVDRSLRTGRGGEGVPAGVARGVEVVPPLVVVAVQRVLCGGRDRCLEGGEA
ncbi:hypothetical protein THAOC_26302, partial [Thalassiosira oceanica]